MRLNLKIKYGKASMDIDDVSVGNGLTSIKWLSMMAAQRFSHEYPKVSGGIKGTHPLPKKLFTEEQVFINPSATIRDVLSDGEQVVVELYDVLELDEHGIPQYAPWSTIAFSTTKPKLREKLIAQLETEAEEINELRSRQREEERISSNLPKIAKMRNMMSDQLLCNDEENITASLVKSEWVRVMQLGVMESLVPRRAEQEVVRGFFQEKYADISHIYKFYSAAAIQGSTCNIEYIEFTRFLSEAKILPSIDHRNMVLKLFASGQATINSEISLSEFFVSLIKIATYKYITLVKREIALCKKQGRRTSISYESLLTTSQALYQMYDEHIGPLISLLPVAPSVMRDALGSEEGLLLMHKHYSSLGRIFCRYADSPFDEGDLDTSINRAALKMKQFIAFSTDFNFYGPSENGKGDITLQDIRQVFSSSQHDSATNEHGPTEEEDNVDTEEEDAHHQELMVFPEFVVGLSRLGVLKHTKGGNSDETNKNCLSFIKMVFERIESGKPYVSRIDPLSSESTEAKS